SGDYASIRRSTQILTIGRGLRGSMESERDSPVGRTCELVRLPKNHTGLRRCRVASSCFSVCWRPLPCSSGARGTRPKKLRLLRSHRRGRQDTVFHSHLLCPIWLRNGSA